CTDRTVPTATPGGGRRLPASWSSFRTRTGPAGSAPADEVARLPEDLVVLRDPGEVLDEAVARALVPGDRRRHSGLTQPLPVQLALVAHRVVLGGDDQRGRQPGEVGPFDGRHQRVRGVGAAVEVEGVE